MFLSIFSKVYQVKFVLLCHYHVKAIGKYSTIGGGYKNYAKGDYSTISGGQQNTIISNYGIIMGGYANLVSGRFGTVLGGSRNTASGHHSVALGFSAVSSGAYSFTACFTGERCINDEDNTIAFFADDMYLNDMSVNDIVATSRMLEEDAYALEETQKLLNEYTEDYENLVQQLDSLLNPTSSH